MSDVDTKPKNVFLEFMNSKMFSDGFFEVIVSYGPLKQIAIAGSLEGAFKSLPDTLEYLKVNKQKDDKSNFDERLVKVEINFFKDESFL